MVNQVLVIYVIYFQGYLSCNRFGTFIGLAHAGMTAEGDNSVLMQKVAKERLTTLTKTGTLKLPTAPASKDIANRVQIICLIS